MNLLATPDVPVLPRRWPSRPAPLLDLRDLPVPGGRISLQVDVGGIVLVDGLTPMAAWRLLAIAAGFAFRGSGGCRHGGVDTGALGVPQRAALRKRMVARAMQRDELDGRRSLFDNGLDAVLARDVPAALAQQQVRHALESLGLRGRQLEPAAALPPACRRLGVLARALACQAPLLVLETPEAGLDEAQVALLQSALWMAAFVAHSGVIMSTRHPLLAALAQRRVAPVST